MREMWFYRGVGALSASALLLTLPGPDSAQARDSSHSITAAVRGLDLTVFGSKVRIASSSAEIDGKTSARATAAGVTTSRPTVASAKVTQHNKRQFARECVPELAMFDVLRVHEACGESRVQTLPSLLPDDYRRPTGAALLGPVQPARERRAKPVDNGGPQAVGRGSVTRVDLQDRSLLEPNMTGPQALLAALTPIREQTVDAARDAVGPALGKILEPLAVGLGLRPGDSVGPLATLLGQLVEGTRNAPLLASVTLAESSAQTNTDAEKVVALAATGGGQIDLLPGFGPGGTPLLSVVVGPSRSVSSFDRATTDRTPSDEPAETRIMLGLPLAGKEVAELVVRPGTPVTLLAGTALETTVSAGRGRSTTNSDGSVGSFVEPSSVHLLSGVKGGIKVQMSQVESAVGAQFDPLGAGPRRTGVDGLLAVGAGSLVVAVCLAVLIVVLVRRRGLRQAVGTEG